MHVDVDGGFLGDNGRVLLVASLSQFDPELPSVAWTGCDAASSSRVRAEAAVEGKDAHRTLVDAGLA